MKAVWSAVCIVCVANLLALLGFVGYLGATDRLSADRVEAVRQVFAPTVSAEQAEAESLAKAEAERQAALEREELPENPPIPSAAAGELRYQQTDVERQQIERMRREADDLRATLARQQAELARQRAAFEKERDEFKKLREHIRTLNSDEQFLQSLGVLEAVKPDDAREILLQTMGDGGEDSRERVVAYLNAMQARTRSKIIAEFVKSGEAELAAELLEELRTFGIPPEPAESNLAATGDQQPPAP